MWCLLLVTVMPLQVAESDVHKPRYVRVEKVFQDGLPVLSLTLRLVLGRNNTCWYNYSLFPTNYSHWQIWTLEM